MLWNSNHLEISNNYLRHRMLQQIQNFKLDHTIIKSEMLDHIYDLHGLLKYVQDLPYGRNSSRDNVRLVIDEQKGTCSSKHAYIKYMHDLHEKEIELVIGIYKMNADNTHGISEVMKDIPLPYIPEAHCYLSQESHRLDITNPNANINSLIPSIIHEEFIEFNMVTNYKIEMHKKFIKSWIEENNIQYSLDQVWAWREECISALSNKL